jgi:hypothetical protein
VPQSATITIVLLGKKEMVLNLLEEEVSIDKILMEGLNTVTTDNNKWVKTILPVQILIKFSEG